MKMCKKGNLKYAIFVRDPTHCWYHRGLASGVDPNFGFESVLSALATGSQTSWRDHADAGAPA